MTSSSALNCGTTVAVASKLALCGSMRVAERDRVGTGAGASSTYDLGAGVLFLLPDY